MFSLRIRVGSTVSAPGKLSSRLITALPTLIKKVHLTYGMLTTSLSCETPASLNASTANEYPWPEVNARTSNVLLSSANTW